MPLLKALSVLHQTTLRKKPPGPLCEGSDLASVFNYIGLYICPYVIIAVLIAATSFFSTRAVSTVVTS